jgi:small subunit ribosomal protein S20
MAHTINALKRHRQSRKRYKQNHAVKTEIKSQVKKVMGAIQKKDAAKAKEEFRRASTLLDRAARKGILHKNNVRRRKARLATKVNALSASPSS